MKIKFLVCCLLTSVFAMAQNKDIMRRYHEGRDIIPSFLYETSDSVWGVSDPAMDSCTAHNMAVTRALFLYAIKNEANLKMMTDSYVNSVRQTNNYDFSQGKIMTLTNMHLPQQTFHYDIIKEIVNDRGETFVCLNIDKNAASSLTITADCDFMISHKYGSHDESEYKVIISLSSKDDDKIEMMGYSLKGFFDNPAVMSTYGDYDMFLYSQPYWYNNEGTISGDNVAFVMKNGLWCAVVESLSYNMVSACFDESEVRNTNETFKNSSQSLIRELVNCKVSCVPDLKGIKDNKLVMTWDIRKQ